MARFQRCEHMSGTIDNRHVCSSISLNISFQNPKLQEVTQNTRNMKLPKFEVLKKADGTENVQIDDSDLIEPSAPVLLVVSVHSKYANYLLYVFAQTAGEIHAQRLLTKAGYAREAALLYNRNSLTPTKKVSPTGADRRRISEIIEAMPLNLEADSADSGRVVRYAFVAAGFEPGTEEWQKYAAEEPRDMERRKAMLAVLNGKENGGILLCESGGPQFGVPRRTVSRDIDRVAKALGYRGNFISKQLQHDFHLSDDYRRVITASVLEYQPPVHGKRPLINDTNAALLVTLHTQRSKIAPVSRRAAIREFRNIVHATGEEMAKIATTEKEKAEAQVFIDAKVDRRVVRKAQARGWSLLQPGRNPAEAPQSM